MRTVELCSFAVGQVHNVTDRQEYKLRLLPVLADCSVLRIFIYKVQIAGKYQCCYVQTLQVFITLSHGSMQQKEVVYM